MKEKNLASPKINTIIKLLVYLFIIGAILGTATFYLSIGGFRLTLFRVILVIIWFLFLLRFLLNKGKLNISHIKIKPYLLFLIIWLIYSIFTLGWAISKSDVLHYTYFLFTGFSIIFFITFYLHSLKDIRRFYALWIIVAIIFICMGIWECYTGNNFISTQHSKVGIFFPTAVYTNTNFLAIFLALSLPFILAWLHYKRKISEQILSFSFLLGGFYVLVMTGSRANILALLFVISIFFLFILWRFREKIKLIVPAFLIVILLFGFGSTFIDNIVEALRQEIEMTGKLNKIAEYSPDSPFFMRKNLLEGSILSFINSFGFGVGAGNIDRYLGSLEPQKVYAGEDGKRNPHNWWAEILANFGIFIFLGYLIFYFGLIRALRNIQHHLILKSEKIICEGLFLSLISFSIAVLSPSSIVSFGPHWLLFAFALVFLNYYRNNYQLNKVVSL